MLRIPESPSPAQELPLFSQPATPATREVTPPEFETLFLNDVREHGPQTAGAVRERHGIPPSNSIGAAVKNLARRKLITPAGFDAAAQQAAHGRLTIRWMLRQSEATR